MNNENYARNPSVGIIKALVAAGWEGVNITDAGSLWQKGDKRLLIDSVGVFLFHLEAGRWLRVAGLSHNLISHRARRITFKNLSVLDLTTGLLEHK